MVQTVQWFTETEKHLYALLQDVRSAADTHGSTIKHMRIDHRRVQPLVAHQFLDRADVLASFQQVSGERTPKGMTTCCLGDSSGSHSQLHGLLHHPGVHLHHAGNQMTATFSPRDGITPASTLGKNPLPSPVPVGVGMFP